MTVINTNIASLNSQAALAVNQRGLAKAMQELSTGKRINSASDDAAGLAISDKLMSQIRGYGQAVRNANDAISMLQTAEGATNEITNMLQRMRELAIQSANDTNGSGERDALQSEYSALRTEINRVSTTTKFNNMGILDGSAGTSGEVTFQVGATSDADNQVTFTFSDFSTSGITADIASDDLSTLSGAQSAIDNVDSALTAVDNQRASMGALINRFQYTVDNLTNISVHASESRSRITDADYSQASANLSKHQIIQQAATAMLAQANQLPQSVLQLLK
jgi:flagellin